MSTIDQATTAIRNDLSTGVFNGVSRSELQHVQSTLKSLTPDEATAVFRQLSDDQLQLMANELLPEGWNRFDGFSAGDRNQFYSDMAKQLDGQQLARFAGALNDAETQSFAQAVASTSTPDAKADFVSQMASTGQVQTGKQDGGQQYTAESRAVADVLGSLQGQSAAFDRAVQSLSDEQLKTVLAAGRGENIDRGLFSSTTTMDARALESIQNVANTTGSVETRARVAIAVNEQIASLKPSDTVSTNSGQRLQPSIVPSLPRSADEIAAKKAEIAEQQQLIADLRAQGTPEATRLANQLQTDYHAREMGNLASDVYHWADPKAHMAAPVGWTRASENPQLLARYGLTVNDLRPAGSGFRAELYIPDPSVHGPDAKPVLSFKGTTPDQVEDWANNFTQGTGKETDYYNRAMRLGVTVSQATDGAAELTGHSLGGGMASAASAVSGMNATTFNAAGLHSATAPRFLAANPNAGTTTPYDTNTLVQPYQVKGEILTTLQESAKDIDPKRADQLGSVVRFAAGAVENPFIKGQAESRLGPVGDFSGLATAQGSDLLAMAEAAGAPNAIKLEAYEMKDGKLVPSPNAAAEFVGANGIATRATGILDRMDARIAEGDRQAQDKNWVSEKIENGRVRVAAGRAAYDEYRADPVLQGAPAALGESVKRHGTYNESLDRRIDVLEHQARTLLK